MVRKQVFIVLLTCAVTAMMTSLFFHWQNRQSPLVFAQGDPPAHFDQPEFDHLLADETKVPRLSSRHSTAIPRYSLPKNIVNDPVIENTKSNGTDEGRFIRAVLVFLPSENQGGQFAAELRWLHRSWREMLKKQPHKWRTDIVVVTNKHIPVLDELKCVAASRSSFREPDKCRYAEGYNPVLNDFADYKPVYSIHSVTWEGVDLDPYDYILRTDIDIFLTPGFSTWQPKHMVVGGGGYIQGPQLLTSHRLQRVADYLRLKYKGMDNIGSTWYGPVQLVKRAAHLSLECMRYLKKHEFTQLERSPQFGVQGWPEWHYGVLTMYGGHIAINHLAADYEISIELNLLDFYSTSSEPVMEHPHIHTWHTDEVFSKFEFLAGGYKNVSTSSLNINICRDYCLYIALESRKLTPKGPK